MIDMELLSAIGDLMDAKLEIFEKKIDAKLEALEQRMDAKLEALEQRMNSRFDALEARVAKVEEGVTKLEVRVAKVEESVTRLEKQVAKLEDRVAKVEKQVDDIDTRVKKLEYMVEYMLLPRVRLIEECYLSTYKRYKEYCERMEQAFADIDVLKITVHEHSLRLQMQMTS